MGKEIKKKSAKEASNILHNIMAVSVKGNPKPVKKKSKSSSYENFFILLLLLPICGICQDSSFYKVPLNDNEIIYERVFNVDSINNKDKLFNAVKSALIKATNYKVAKVDEDRTAGSITTNISFSFIAKPGIMKLAFDADTKLSIDVKENRFRVRLYDNSAHFVLMGERLVYGMYKTYFAEKEQISKGKWKEAKSIILPWDEELRNILYGFSLMVSKGLSDEF